MSDELAILNPGVEIDAGGEKILVKPFTFGQMGKAAKLIADLMPAVLRNRDADGNINVAGLVADAFDPVYALMALSLGKKREWFDGIEMAEGLALAVAIFEQNKDYFAKKIQPMRGQVGAFIGKSASPAPAQAPEAGDQSTLS